MLFFHQNNLVSYKPQLNAGYLIARNSFKSSDMEPIDKATKNGYQTKNNIFPANTTALKDLEEILKNEIANYFVNLSTKNQLHRVMASNMLIFADGL